MPFRSQTKTTLQQVIELLSDGCIHDGNSMGSKLKLSRCAIWKTIKKLQDYGVSITSSQSVGYRLRDPLILLDKKILTDLLHSPKLKISVFESIDSTQDYLKKHFASQVDHLCLSEIQKKGRGRLEKSWYSPFGKNIYFSLLKTFPQDVSTLSGLSLVVGLAIIHALSNDISNNGLKIKWPNDIWFYQEKLAGVLIDLQAQAHGMTRAIIGIGINVNMETTHHINQAWTSMRKISGQSFDRNIIVANVFHTLNEYLDKFMQGGLKIFLNEWKKYDALFGKPIRLSAGLNSMSGIARGINDQGHLCLQFPEGEKKYFSSAEASLIKY